jgi:hypothetical protein
LTTAPRIKPTSIFLRSARRPNPGRGFTYRRGIAVQTTGTSSQGFGPAPLFALLTWRVHLFDDCKLGNIAVGQMKSRRPPLGMV